ncbi:MAG: hypothetical protein OHK0039_32680 [Bacteroidia bacterium]
MKKFLSDTFFITVGGFANRVKGLLFIPLIVQAVGMESYGAFVQVLNNIRLLKPFSSISLGMGFQRFASKIEDSDRRTLGLHFYTVFVPTLLFGLLGVAFLAAFATLLSRWFFEGGYVLELQLSAIALLSNSMYSNISKYMLARKQFKIYSVLTMVYELLPYLAFVVGIAIPGGSFLLGIVAYVVLDMAMVLLMLGFIVFQFPFVLPSYALFREYLRFSFPLSLSEVEGGLLDKVDRYFISGMMGLEAVAVYNIIYRVCSIIDFVTTPIRKQMMSYLPKVWDKGYIKESLATIRNSLLLFLLITIGMLACFTIYFGEILRYLGGKEIAVPHLELIVLLVGVGIIASAAKRFYYLVVKLRNNSMDQLWYQLLGLLPNIVLNYLLIPSMGLLGAALSTFISYVLIILVINMKYKLDLDGPFFWHLASFLALSLVMLLIRQAFAMETTFLFILNVGLSCLAYGALIILLKRSFLLDVKRSFEAFRKIK